MCTNSHAEVTPTPILAILTHTAVLWTILQTEPMPDTTPPTAPRRIIAARITAMPRPMPEGMFDPMPTVMVKCADDEPEVRLFDYYPNELSFRPEEFIGLTIREGHELKRTKDIAYLQAP